MTPPPPGRGTSDEDPAAPPPAPAPVPEAVPPPSPAPFRDLSGQQVPPGQFPPGAAQYQFPPGRFRPDQPQSQLPPGGYPPPGYGGMFPPPPSQPPARSRTGLIIGALAVGTLVLATILLVMTFLPARDGTDVAADPAVEPKGAVAGDTGGSVEVSVEVGDCVQLRGTENAAAARPAECGSPDANHKVVGKAPSAEECIRDSDAVYYESLVLGMGEAGALCLDIDWVQGDCFELGEENVQRVDCAAPGEETVRVGERIEGTSDEYACPVQGVPYPTRNFVVCLEASTEST